MIHTHTLSLSRSSQSVSAVDAEISTGNVFRRITEEESDGAHQVLGDSHFTHGNQRDPLVLQIWVIVEDLARPVVSQIHR